MANFCDENPDQSTDNTHCFHVVKSWRLPIKKGQRKTLRRTQVESQCCWCGERTFEEQIVPVAHGKKAMRLR